MLSKEQNELLCRIGPGTPMGQAIRQVWVPAVRSSNLEVDGAPQRVRVLGQDFVAFRDTNGRVGFLDEACPHRGVSLALGRNEECGLRCIFHGWKMNVDGQVVEVPSEPAGSNLASKVRVNNYKVHEAGGLVWVYLGKEEEAPQFPDFGFENLPPENVLVRKSIVHCNWVGLVEGLLDSSHVTSLHTAWLPHGDAAMTGPNAGMMGALSVQYEIHDRPYGYMANAKRKLKDGTYVNRKSEYVLPFFCLIPSTVKNLYNVNIVMPIDDEHTDFWLINWDPTGPLTAAAVDQVLNLGQLSTNADNLYEDRVAADGRWGQDRELMARDPHSVGFKSLPIEDLAVTESQGAIADRSKEHLGASDIAIIRMRRALLEMVRVYQETGVLPIYNQPIDYTNIRPVHELLDKNGDKIHFEVVLKA
jgi:phthalate 4,5-dioxygenase oxygenase subunit